MTGLFTAGYAANGALRRSNRQVRHGLIGASERSDMTKPHTIVVDVETAHCEAAQKAVTRSECASLSEVIRDAMETWLRKRWRRAYKVEDLPDVVVDGLRRSEVPRAHDARNDEAT